MPRASLNCNTIETDHSSGIRLRLSKDLTQYRQDHEERSTRPNHTIYCVHSQDRIELTLAVCLPVAGIVADAPLIGRESVFANDLKVVSKTSSRSRKKRMQKGRERNKTRV